MQQNLIQFLAAMANGRTRARFAEICLAGEHGVPASERDDALLIAAGVIEVDAGRAALREHALRELLDTARGSLAPQPAGRIDLLPRQRKLRLEVLGELAGQVLGGAERVPERELNDRLAARVNDIPGVRRALIDEGILAREADGSAYWRVDPD